jgi:hypothetical protein
MGRQQHGHALVLEVADDVEQFCRRLRVETGGRLVEDRDLRLFHQDFSKAEPLAHAARECPHALVGDIREPNMGERRLDVLLAFLPFEPDQARRVAQIVGGGEIVIEADLVGQSRPAASPRAAALRVASEHARLAIRDVAQAEQHQDGGGLAGAVSGRAARRSHRAPPQTRCP